MKRNTQTPTNSHSLKFRVTSQSLQLVVVQVPKGPPFLGVSKKVIFHWLTSGEPCDFAPNTRVAGMVETIFLVKMMGSVAFRIYSGDFMGRPLQPKLM